jgi:hypothetical protein
VRVAVLVLFSLILGIVLAVWRVVLFIKCLAEVHRFSAWRGLAAAVLGTLAVVVPLFILFFACVLSV